mmetsp:Transcript_16079/g.41618  ORF Transcript_16079/g.41618 Transcript_16079/m.41618 type:complete len:271 (+) Transcript_16079:1-813(+)
MLKAHEHALLVTAAIRPWRTALALFVLVSTLLNWQLVLVPCTTCFDFETVAAHEIGHVLGIGHPTTSPYLKISSPESESREDVACGTRLQTALEVGVAADGAAEAVVDVGETIMSASSRFERNACIGQDDLDALNALYPACDEGANLGSPLCAQSRRSLGATRLLTVVLIPLVSCVCLVFAVVSVARRRAWRIIGRLKALEGGSARDKPAMSDQLSAMPKSAASSYAHTRACVLRADSSRMLRGGSSGSLPAAQGTAATANAGKSLPTRA